MKKLLSIFLGLTALLSLWARPSRPDLQQLNPDLKLRMAEQIISNYYVEDVDRDTMVQEAIIAMLSTLDPHSSYTTPSETEELTQPLDGKFSGIGVQFNMSTDTVYVIQTVGGGPSEKVGIRPGDKIIMADTIMLAGRKLPNSKVMQALRGEKGSKVTLKVKRGSQPELLEFVVTRDDIPVYSLTDAFMVNDSVGYISFSRFAEESPEEMREAIEKLRAKGMKALIISLEDNGGGYLGAAYSMAADFLKNGDLVVYTKGRATPDQLMRATTDGPYADMPLVVLVDQYSASASEIFAGAMQDNDRAVVVGRRTFGKGLVQRPFPFPDGSMIRLTTSRYYTPAGRCIQKPYDKGHTEEYMLDMYNRYKSGELWSADSIKVDSTQVFKTMRSGRTVYGGGGIVPDVFVPVDTTYFTEYYRSMLGKGSLNNYVLNYVDTNRSRLENSYLDEDMYYRNFEVTPEMLQDLIDRTTADSTEYNDQQWQRSKPYVAAVLKGLIARDLFERGSYVRAVSKFNPVFSNGVDVITDRERYNRLLKP